MPMKTTHTTSVVALPGGDVRPMVFHRSSTEAFPRSQAYAAAIERPAPRLRRMVHDAALGLAWAGVLIAVAVITSKGWVFGAIQP